MCEQKQDSQTVEVKSSCKSLEELFDKQLNIPAYQRGYCWEEKQVKGLLESICDIADSTEYHLGTVILHKHKDVNKQEDVYDVVDGQQRLITLSLILNQAMKDLPKEQQTVALPLLSCETSDKDVIRHIWQNAQTISEWMKCHKNNYVELCRKLVFCVVEISGNNEDEFDDRALSLAWTFFNAINSGGKRLSDYDLLKAHHLRHLSMRGDCGELTMQFKASKWDENSEARVATFGGENVSLYKDSFAHTFYLIRSWLRNRPVVVSDSPGDGKYCILNHYSALLSFEGSDGTMREIFSGIIGGKPFFDWTEFWMWQYRQFCGNPVVKRFMNIPWKFAQRHLHIIARAILFYYFCRFGDVYLADACVFILFRIGRLRNTTARSKDTWYGARGGMLAPHTMQALDESPTPEHFFRYCAMPSNKYVRHYNLKDANSDDDLKKSWRHGPDWWKHYLSFVASSVTVKGNAVPLPNCESYCIGQSVCFKEKVAALLNEIASDFGWQYDSTLNLNPQKQPV